MWTCINIPVKNLTATNRTNYFAIICWKGELSVCQIICLLRMTNLSLSGMVDSETKCEVFQQDVGITSPAVGIGTGALQLRDSRDLVLFKRIFMVIFFNLWFISWNGREKKLIWTKMKTLDKNMITFLNTCNNIAGWSFLRALPKGGFRGGPRLPEPPLFLWNSVLF